MGAAGRQIDSQLLYERQHALHSDISAPAIIADGLRTPENMGAVLRLAEAAGSRSVMFIKPEKFDCCSAQKIHRAARGAEQRVIWDSCDSHEFLAGMQQPAPYIAIEITEKSNPIFATSLPDECTFIIGNERQGISEGVLARCQQAVHIPMFGANGSMNVTHALAIALFEWRRQQS